MLRTIIVDDEIDAADFIESVLTENIEQVEIIAKINSALEAIKQIQHLKPDLVLLDIEMPFATGFDVLESIPARDFHVVFVTAYSQYAVKAFRYSAFDFILKPVDIEDLISTVERVITIRQDKNFKRQNFDILFENIKTEKPSKLALSTDKGLEYIPINDIIRIHADGVYSTFYLKDKRKIVVTKNIGTYQELLDDHNFFRSHRSHLINIQCVKAFVRQDGGYIEMEDGSVVDVSRQKRDEFIALMDRHSC